jgi:hypothetical protein
MPICPSCGVELAESAKICPLCRSSLTLPPGSARESDVLSSMNESDIEVFETLSSSAKEKVFLEVFSVCSMIASFVVLAVELIISHRVRWSLYPIVSIAYLCALVCVPVLLKRHRLLALLIIAPASLLYVFSIALVSGGMFWFVPVGMPIVLIVEFAVAVCVMLSACARRKGVNVIAIILIGISIICAGVETVLTLYYSQRFLLSWSAVVATACLSVSVFLFYVHYRFKSRSSLKKLFHL